jgi:hypothetical protein
MIKGSKLRLKGVMVTRDHENIVGVNIYKTVNTKLLSGQIFEFMPIGNFEILTLFWLTIFNLELIIRYNY